MRAVFIGACARSGTTFLGSLLGAHPLCLTTPESAFKIHTLIASHARNISMTRAFKEARSQVSQGNWSLHLRKDSLFPTVEESLSVARAAYLIVEAYGRQAGAPSPEIWVDHTPANILYVERLRRHFPGCKFIHLIRDGRAVAASLMPLPWGPRTVQGAADFWLGRIGAGLAAEMHSVRDDVLRIRFEDLILETQMTLHHICDFLDLEFDPDMLTKRGFIPNTELSKRQHPLVSEVPDPTRIHAWKQALKPRQVEIFEYLTGDVLSHLGYESFFGERARSPSWSEKLQMELKELMSRLSKNLIYRLRQRKG